MLGRTPRDVSHARKGDLVWGKIHGFPWWPSVVRDVSQWRGDDKQLRVTFLGPTRDDITTEVMAETFGRELFLDEASLETLAHAEPCSCSIMRHAWITLGVAAALAPVAAAFAPSPSTQRSHPLRASDEPFDVSRLQGKAARLAAVAAIPVTSREILAAREESGAVATLGRLAGRWLWRRDARKKAMKAEEKQRS